MKILLLSDVHGSAFYLEKTLAFYSKFCCDEIVILGDVYYHGPRNPLPEGYAPMDVAKTLNSFDGKLTVIKGNCDCEVDQTISDFKFVKSAKRTLDGKVWFFTHGHVFNADNLPACLLTGGVLCHGHTHCGGVQQIGNVYVVNPGSVSLPKDCLHSFMTVENSCVSRFDVDGNKIDEHLIL